MLKKSKVIALLVVCVMMFAAVEPALAWWGEDTAYGGAVGGATGGFWGAIIGAAIVAVPVVLTGGLAAIPMAGAAIGGAALTGAGYGAAGGAATGAVIGAVSDKETVNTAAKVASVVAPVAAAGYIAAPYIVAAVSAGGTAASTAGTATIGVGGSAVEGVKNIVNDNKDTIKDSITSAATTAWQGVSAMGTLYGAYEGVQYLYGLVKPDDDENLKLLKKVDDRIQKLAKEGKKVELKKVELPTRKSVTAYYTVDGVEHVETFNNK